MLGAAAQAAAEQGVGGETLEKFGAQFGKEMLLQRSSSPANQH